MRAVIRYCAAIATLLIPASVAAGPIIPGTHAWSAVGTPDGDGTPFWDNLSQKSGCDVPAAGCNAGLALLQSTLLNTTLDPSIPLEYLHNGSYLPVAFKWDGSVLPYWKPEFSETSLTDGFHGQLATGEITYTIPGATPQDPLLFFADSITHPAQFTLFRQIGTTQTLYFFGFDDRFTGSDYDYNDLIMSVQERTVAPEPATLALLGSGIAAVALRRRRRT